MKGVAIVTAALVAGHHCTTTLAQTDSLVTFVNVNVVSMDRDQVEPGRTVTVRGDRIVAIDASSPPDGALVVDGRGGYLAPGLTDSHVHSHHRHAMGAGASGFRRRRPVPGSRLTTVVNLRGTPMQLDWKRRVEAGGLPGPTIYTSGEFVNEPRVSTPDEVQREVEAQARDGYDLIKFHEIAALPVWRHPGLSRESYLRMFESARRAELQVVGHVPVNLGVDALLASSGGAVAHLGELVRLYFRPPLWVLLIYAASTLILLLIAVGWGAAAARGRWRSRPSSADSLMRARMLASIVPAGCVAAFAVGLAGPGDSSSTAVPGAAVSSSYRACWSSPHC